MVTIRQNYVYWNICALIVAVALLMLLPSLVQAQENSADIATGDTEFDATADKYEGQAEYVTQESIEENETIKIIVEANQFLSEELSQMRQDVTQLQITVTQLRKALQQDLSETELKNLRKKQSKDIANIILRFQDRIDFIEQQTVEFTGKMDEITFELTEFEAGQVDISNHIIEVGAEKHDQLLELIARQNKLLKSQQTTIRKHSKAINRLEKNNNILVKQIQNLAN